MFIIKNKKIKKGSVAVFALIIMFILAVATIGIITTASIERKTSISTGNSTTAFQIAESGMESTLQAFKDHFDEQLSAIGCSGGSIVTGTNTVKFRKRGAAASVYASCSDYISDIGVIKSIGTTKTETRAIEQDVFLGATKLLLHFDGKNDDGDFEDSSFYYEKNNPVELNGDADVSESTNPQKFSTLNATFGQNSNSDGYLNVDVDNSNKNYYYFKDEDFTIDFWVYPTAVNISRAGLVSQVQASDKGWWVELDSSIVKFYAIDGSTIFQISSSTPIAAGSWYHIAAVRKKGTGNGFKLFINGELKGSDSNDTMPDFGNSDVRIGQSFPSALFKSLRGYIDEVRISKGVARWNSDFSGRLPADPYQAD